MKKIYSIDSIPLLITLIIALISIIKIIISEYILTNALLVGFLMLGVCTLVFFCKKKIYYFLFLFFLILGILQVLDIYTTHMVIGFKDKISVNPLFIVLLILYVALNESILESYNQSINTNSK